MSVRLAKTAGFCMGVRRAVDMAVALAGKTDGARIFTYGPLIHNPQMVEILRRRGIVPVEDSGEIDPAGPPATIIIRAHGISPRERERLRAQGIRIVDATCPKVAHVQAIIRKHAAGGYAILIAGDCNHPEVEGLLGYAGERGRVISAPSDVDGLPDMDRVCVVAQTTQSLDEYASLCARIRGRFPDALVFDTICHSTEERQAEVKHLARAMDAMVIAGGRNSANTRRLAELSAIQGTPTFHVETAAELRDRDLQAYRRIGVSAGASTPNWVTDRIVDHLVTVQEDQSRLRWLSRGWLFLVRTDLYSALGAGCLALAATLLQGLSASPPGIAAASLYVWAMHVLNRFIRGAGSNVIGSFREESYRIHERTYVTLASFSLGLSLTVAAIMGTSPFVLLFLLSLAGVLYNLRLLPAQWRFRSLRDVPGSKNLSMASAWALVCAVLPAIASPDPRFTGGLGVAFAFAFVMVFVRSALSDMIDIQSDRIIGKETIPVLIGEGRTRILLWGVTSLWMAMLVAGAVWGWVPPGGLILAPAVFSLWICMFFCDRKARFSGIVLEGLLETTYIIAGICALGWLFAST